MRTATLLNSEMKDKPMPMCQFTTRGFICDIKVFVQWRSIFKKGSRIVLKKFKYDDGCIWKLRICVARPF
jgi:hypothetical protein